MQHAQQSQRIPMASLSCPWRRCSANSACSSVPSTSYPIPPPRSLCGLSRSHHCLEQSQRASYVNCRIVTRAASQATTQLQQQAEQSSQHSAHQDAPSDGRHLAQQESLSALEWPSICRQVACFCHTVMGTQTVVSGRLPIGRTQRESEQMLQQTTEALEANISLQGVFDLRPALDAATSGLCLSARQLEGVAKTLEVAFAAKDAACARRGGSSFVYPHLASIAEGILDSERELMHTILKCVKSGYVTDDASDDLQTVRQQRVVNKAALRAAIAEQAKLAFSKGASDSQNNEIIIRGRYCIGIKAGRSGDLPKGSTKVGQSQSGATHYFEPAPVVTLNNTETLLDEKERREELAVRGFLSQRVAARAGKLATLLEAAAALDIVAARAAHAKWLKGVRPRFGSWRRFREAQRLSWASGAGAPPPPAASSGEGASAALEGDDLGGAAVTCSSALHLPGALHPLLLEPSLPPLPEPPSVDDNAFESDFQEKGAWEVRRSLVSPPPAERSGSGAPSRPAPRALDLQVPDAAAVVAITGPNTGGKTVTLKTAGLAALMAKAGLYIPVTPEALQPQPGSTDAEGTEQHGGGAGGRAVGSAGAGVGSVDGPQLLWFDQVLADIGDTQSLQQNLSTFSGHVRRIRSILGAVTQHSLVLLDEVGSGTDPQEGAALARAVLDRLADRAGLTLATTHHAELKTVAVEDARYTNVSMEFDVASLAPTYRLCWGSAGASNALDIARALGFDSEVVREARSVARATAARQRDAVTHMEAVAASLEKQLAEARADLESLRRRREEAEQKLADLGSEMQQLAVFKERVEQSPRQIAKEVKKYAADLQAAVDRFGEGKLPADALQQDFAKLEDQIPELISRVKSIKSPSDFEKDDVVWVDRLSREAIVTRVVGDSVFVRPVPLKGGQVDILSFDPFGSAQSKLKYKKGEVRLLSKAQGVGSDARAEALDGGAGAQELMQAAQVLPSE